MSLIIGDNFNYQGKQANFKRDTFNTLSDMKSYPETSIDEGHISFCIETGKRYKYSSKNTSDSTLGKWRLIVDTQLDATSENPVQNKAIVQKFLADEQTATQGLKTLNETYDKRISENEEAVGESLNDLNNKVEMFAESASAAINNLENTKLDSTITVNGRGINGGNNISLTKSDIGLGNVDNTSDLNKPVSNATQNALNQKVSIRSGYDLMSNTLKTKLEELPNSSSLSSMFATRDTNLSNHIKDTSNPHNVTAKQVGLDSYSPYTPSTLPISGPAQTALDGKVDKTTTVNGHALSGNVTVTKSDLVIENVDNTSDINKPISKATQFALNLKADLASPALTGTPTAPTATEGTSTTQLATTAFVTSADNKKVDKTTTVNGHALSGNVTVTKGDVGLGNCDNTSDANKPISTATQTALNGKVDKTTTVNGHALSGNVTVTKSDVGLGNCDNTSDANKPISTATQKALDLKADLDEVLSNEDTSAESLSNLKDSLEQLQLGLSGALRDINSRLGVVENKATTGLSTSLPGNPSTGNMIFATNLGKPIWYTGSKWVDATGASI